jgi:hypothetical protein
LTQRLDKKKNSKYAVDLLWRFECDNERYGARESLIAAAEKTAIFLIGKSSTAKKKMWCSFTIPEIMLTLVYESMMLEM